MLRFSLRKGLNVPILGQPRHQIEDCPAVHTVGILGDDYLGMKPRILVAEGDVVAPGTPILIDKDMPDVQVVSPVAGKVAVINRGARRKLIGIEIEVVEGAAEPVDFSSVGDVTTPGGLAERLCAAGLWTSFLTRPYSKIPDPASRPAAIYVTA
ncbi:MAG: NADH:ubiquinone reductase (Na(+)-transporting) subunit A, partial [Pseudomonadota bacterium]